MKTSPRAAGTVPLHAEPFTDPRCPASGIGELILYLKSTDNQRYLYRGQTRAYPGPLLPSEFRRVLRDEPTITAPDPLQQASIRGVGRRFVGNYVWDKEDYHNGLAARLFGSRGSDASVTDNSSRPQTGRDATAYLSSHFQSSGDKWIETLPFDPLDVLVISSWLTNEFNLLSAATGTDTAIQKLVERYVPPLAARPEVANIIRDYVNERHRHRFYTDILMGAYSYVLGSLISQQYGFHSGLLDATTSIDVAAFFATHDAPEYHLVTSESPEPLLGVIYRLPRSLEVSEAHTVTADAYGKCGSLVVDELLQHLEDDVTVSESLKLLRTSFELRHLPDYWARRYDLLKFPVGSVAGSRIGRQKAAVIIPDQIEVLLDNAFLATTYGRLINHPNNRIQMSIEDISWRSDLRPFYFLHSGVDPCPDISPSDLWPNDNDFFLLALTYLFKAHFSCYLPLEAFVCPERHDLVDPGFGSINHARLLSEVNAVLAEESKQNPQEVGAASTLSAERARQAYFVYKAATLIYEANVTGKGAPLQAALGFCRCARAWHPSSPTLVALELVATKDLGHREECQRMAVVGEQAVAREYGHSAHDVTLDRFRRVASFQGRPEFAVEVFELYRQDPWRE